MMRAKFGGLLAVALLAGCSNGAEDKNVAQISQWLPAERDPAEYAAAQLQFGKEALDYKQYGMAIIAFRNLQRFPDHAAAAYNGLGIAYAQLGRPDLAERFFKQAVAAAPQEKSYYANLSNFYASSAHLAWRTTRDAQWAAQDNHALFASFDDQFEARRPEVTGAVLTRVSDSEVRLQTPQDASAGAGRRINRAALASAAAAPLPAARRRATSTYPVRIDLTQLDAAPATQQPTSAAAAYPVRIDLATVKVERISAGEVWISSPVQPAASKATAGRRVALVTAPAAQAPRRANPRRAEQR